MLIGSTTEEPITEGYQDDPIFFSKNKQLGRNTITNVVKKLFNLPKKQTKL